MNALAVKNLTKRYPAFLLDGVSFTVEEGSVTGLIGANGAGKSTTIKAITGLISCEGDADAFGVSFRETDAFKQLIGYAGGGFRFYPQKKLGAIVSCVRDFYRFWDEKRFEKLFARYSLDLNKKVSELSEGMKVKLSIVLALSHGARLLILDEPTSGLDPLSREEFCDSIYSLVREEGVSVLFSTHVTSDLTRIADDVVYLSAGRVLAAEPLDELMQKYRLAVFAQKPDVPVIGLKEGKDGFRGLIGKDAAAAGATLAVPTLDEIMVHLETERRKICAR